MVISMKPILTLFVRACFIICTIFGVAAILLLLAALFLSSRHLLVWAALCVCSSVVLWVAAFVAIAIEEDAD